MSYFDSSYIAKFYLDEPESEAVRRLAESLGQVRCALIGQIEVAAVFHRKFRRKGRRCSGRPPAGGPTSSRSSAQEIADDLRSALGQIEDILGDLEQRVKERPPAVRENADG